MASPFDRFRKNQKTWLAVFGVLLMVAWGVGDSLSRAGSGNSANPVIVETKYGDYNFQTLSMMKESRALVEQFLYQLVEKSMEKTFGHENLNQREQQAVVQIFSSLRGQLLGRRSQNSPDAEAIETLVLAKKAEQLGIVVSNATINEYLRQISAGTLTDQDLAQIIAGMSTRAKHRVSQSMIFEAIRTEMLASKMLEMFQTSMAGITPAQRWDYFVRLNRRATVEVMPVPVAGFVDQVGEPTQAELTAFFDEHKSLLPNPDSPVPGFKIPRKGAFQYFKASPELMLTAALEKVTDAEIAEYYEKNKTSFPASELPKNEPAKEEPTGDAKPAEPEKKEASKTDAAPGDKPADAKPTDVKPEGDKPADDSKPEPAKTEPAKTETPAPAPAEEKKSSSVERSPFKLVSLLQEEKKDEAKPAEGAKPAETAAPTTEKKEAAAPTGDKPAAAAPAEPKKEDAPAATDKVAEPPKTEEKPKYEPLEKVKEEIRKTLARQKVNEEIRLAFDELESDMKSYATDFSRYKAERESDPNATPPEKLDFAALAKSKGIAAFEIPLSTQQEIQDGTDIGKSFTFSQRTFRMVPFAQTAFSKDATVFRAARTQDDAGNQYLYWKTEEVPETVPSLEDVKTAVAYAWRLIKARPLALKKANEEAAKVQAEKKTLAEFFGKDKADEIKTAGPFSWMTIGDVPMDPMSNVPRLSEVPGVNRAGESFMAAVFKLQPGQASAALNQPEDTAYVIRMVDYDKPLEEVEKEFASADFRRYSAVARPDQTAMFTTWMDNLETEARVKWVRPPVEFNTDDE